MSTVGNQNEYGQAAVQSRFNRRNIVSRAVCAQLLPGWGVVLAYLSPSPRGLSLIPGFGVLERIIMGDVERLKKKSIRTK